MKQSRLKFRAHIDAGEVSALLQIPDNPIGIATLAHGAGAGMEHPSMQAISEALVRQNLATFRYQFPFMQRGGGRDSLDVSLATVQQATRTARQSVPSVPLIAGGHSFGGRMTALAAIEEALPEVSGLFFCSYPLHAAGKPSADRAEHLPKIKLPILFISGTRDPMMTFDLLKPTLTALGDRATFKWLETGDHGYKTLKRVRPPEDNIFEQLSQILTDWFQTLTCKA